MENVGDLTALVLYDVQEKAGRRKTYSSGKFHMCGNSDVLHYGGTVCGVYANILQLFIV